MPAYTVTVTFAPAGDWSRLYDLLDVIPGSYLIEDPAAPTAVMVVDAESQHEAFRFADGVFKVLGLHAHTGKFELFEPVAGLDDLLGTEPPEHECVPTGEVRDWNNALACC